MTAALEWVVQIVCDGAIRDRTSGWTPPQHSEEVVAAFCVTRDMPDVDLDKAKALLVSGEIDSQVELADGVNGTLLTGDKTIDDGRTLDAELLNARAAGALRHSYTLKCPRCQTNVEVRHESVEPWVRKAAENGVSKLNLPRIQP